MRTGSSSSRLEAEPLWVCFLFYFDSLFSCMHYVQFCIPPPPILLYLICSSCVPMCCPSSHYLACMYVLSPPVLVVLLFPFLCVPLPFLVYSSLFFFVFLYFVFKSFCTANKAASFSVHSIVFGSYSACNTAHHETYNDFIDLLSFAFVPFLSYKEATVKHTTSGY